MQCAFPGRTATCCCSCYLLRRCVMIHGCVVSGQPACQRGVACNLISCVTTEKCALILCPAYRYASRGWIIASRQTAVYRACTCRLADWSTTSSVPYSWAHGGPVGYFATCAFRDLFFVGPGNGSPMATNVVLVLVVGVVVIRFSKY